MPLTCIYLCLLDYRLFEGRVLVLFIIPSHITYSISQHIFIVPSAWGGVSSVQLLSHVQLFCNPWTAACQAPLSTGFLRQENWSGCHFLFKRIFSTQGSIPCLLPAGGFFTTNSPGKTMDPIKTLICMWKWSRSVVSNSLRPHGL